MFLVFVPRNTNTHTETQFTQHEASLDIERVLSQLIGCTLRLDTPNYILFIKFSSKRFLLISVHQNHLCSPLWDNFCNYIWSEIISKVNNTLQKKPHYFNLLIEWIVQGNFTLSHILEYLDDLIQTKYSNQCLPHKDLRI